MRDTQRFSSLPDNADKVLFAEDFVNHFLHRFKLPLLSSGIANHRPLIHDAFNSEVKLAANYVYRRLDDEMLEEFENISRHNNTLDMNAFLKYAIPLKFHTSVLPTELGAHNLMQFCVKISTTAAKFYKHGFLDAPVLAVDYIIGIINDIDMGKGGWDALDIVATGYAQDFIEMDNYLTPESASDYDYETDSLSTLSSKNSEASCSPDHEMDVPDGQHEYPEEFSDRDYCKLSVVALSSSAAEPVSLISHSEHVEETHDAKADNIVSFSVETTDSVSSGSPKENLSSASFHSFEETSSEDDDSKQKVRKKPKKKPSYSHPKESDSDSDNKCGTDPNRLHRSV